MPIVAFVHLFFHQLIAFPLYLIINNLALERMAAARWWQRSHFYLGCDGPNFKPDHFRDVLISNFGIAIVAMALWAIGKEFGLWNVMLFYGFPYLWTNHWIRKTNSGWDGNMY
jgi:omega-6 fatty acid desaturase (delta-12 desaturase)